jgi:NAD(P)-dependent dehydrogenase (short-subunit alcohol dehydrogenase family)
MSKVALVTGASSGIGAAIATTLAATAHGIIPVPMDVTDDPTMVAGVRRILAEEGRLDALVNNPGYGSYGSLEHVPLDEARRQFEVNVFGMARLIQLVTPHMRSRQAGRIVNISSIGGKIYEPLGAWYHATEFAVEGLSDSLRIELRPFGIDVVIIEPGPILSEWNTIAARASSSARAGPSTSGEPRPWRASSSGPTRPGSARARRPWPRRCCAP